MDGFHRDDLPQPYDDFYDNLRKPNRGSELVEFVNDKPEHETEKAILVLFRGQEVWIPKSETTRQDGKLFIPRWLYKRKLDEVRG